MSIPKKRRAELFAARVLKRRLVSNRHKKAPEYKGLNQCTPAALSRLRQQASANKHGEAAPPLRQAAQAEKKNEDFCGAPSPPLSSAPRVL